MNWQGRDWRVRKRKKKITGEERKFRKRMGNEQPRKG